MFDWRISLASLALAGLGGVFGLDSRPSPAAQVPLVRASSAKLASPDGSFIHATRSGDGLFYANLELNGKKVRFLIDTGATHMVLTSADARAIGLAPGSGRAGSLQTAAGQRSARWAHFDNATVAGQPLGEVDAIVIADSMQTSLLGQNVLTRLGKLTIDGDSLMINRP